MKRKLIFAAVIAALTLSACSKIEPSVPVSADVETSEAISEQTIQTEITTKDTSPVKIATEVSAETSTPINETEASDETTTTEENASSEISATTPTGAKIEVIDGITYIDGIMVVNKTYSLPSDYAHGVNKDAENAYTLMRADSENEGLNLYISSSYRSYDYQDGLYNRYVSRDGKAAADRYSARAGHSEHQTGLAFDLNTIDDSFADTAEGKWVAENCWKYGFILRYPKGKEDVTGYMYESWHIRYVGNEMAKKIHDSGKTLEEYFGITSEYAE